LDLEIIINKIFQPQNQAILAVDKNGKSFIDMNHNNKQEANPLTEEAVIEIGHITHFFSKISVAVVELSSPIAIGDRILIKGPSTDFEQTVESMQIDRKAIPRAESGQSIGLKVMQPVKEKDNVYKKL
jgi:putative protease